MRLLTSLLFILFLNHFSFAQEREIVQGLFRGTHVISGQSAETQRAGNLDLYIAHRFGTLNSGPYQWFGLDNASMRLGFDYGLTDRIALNIGRSTIGKEYDTSVKYRLLRQSNLIPVSVTWYSGMFVNGNPPDPTLPLLFQHRLSFSNQLMIARKFNDYFSLQVMPTHIHRNLVATPEISNETYALGLGGRAQITKNLAITMEYYQIPTKTLDLTGTTSPLSIGLDINTGSHVFQIHFTNSSGMQEKAIITNTQGKWQNGDIQFGFNMIRTFKLRGTRY